MAGFQSGPPAPKETKEKNDENEGAMPRLAPRRTKTLVGADQGLEIPG